MKRRSTRQDRGEDRSASGLLSTMLAQALERAMPVVAFRSAVAVFHVRHIFRLDPRSLQHSPQALLLKKLKLQSNIVGRSPCAPVSQAYVRSG